jgi:hypothetical protein
VRSATERRAADPDPSSLGEAVGGTRALPRGVDDSIPSTDREREAASGIAGGPASPTGVIDAGADTLRYSWRWRLAVQRYFAREATAP